MIKPKRDEHRTHQFSEALDALDRLPLHELPAAMSYVASRILMLAPANRDRWAAGVVSGWEARAHDALAQEARDRQLSGMIKGA